MALFRSRHAEVWRLLSEEPEGRFISGAWCAPARVEVRHEPWVLTLDTYMVMVGKVPVTYTRLRAPYRNPGGFRFTIYRKSLFSGLGVLLGMQDIEIGVPPFDDDFVIKSTHSDRVRHLLMNDRLRELIAAQPQLHMEVKDDEGWFGREFGPQVAELYYVVPELVTDVERLKALFALFAETLDSLLDIGAADRQAAH